MDRGVGIRTIGVSHRASTSAINAFGRKAAVNEMVVEPRNSATHVGRKRATVVAYALHLKSAANDRGFEVRDSAAHVRVAEALEVLTEMAQALKDGEICWSALREITRVATPRTETEWLKAARGRSVRQIERLVSGRKPGDGPDDPPDEAHRRHVIRLEVSTEVRRALDAIDSHMGNVTLESIVRQALLVLT